ncbi:Ig-like domain-containing protein [Butyrivibrio sp. WCD3002]|uniref:Ig-like domain-containing protein n=1 Tax=Butyrivibrio sp. WCD3002 TaxID=1280676 RepID=UPI000400D75A|nr:Ig-like domain-containing protein [Butyrivibrio sp. WCD3002]
MNLKIPVAPANASNKTCTYESANEAIATVDANGLVTAIAEGETTVTVKSTDGSNKQAILQIKVPTLATSIEITSETGEFWVYESRELQLYAKVLPANASQKVKWSCKYSDQEIAESNGNYAMEENGLLHAYTDSSEIEVTATATDGSGVSKTVKIEVFGLK